MSKLGQRLIKVMEEQNMHKDKDRTEGQHLTAEDFEKAKAALEAANVPPPYRAIQAPGDDGIVQARVVADPTKELTSEAVSRADEASTADVV